MPLWTLALESWNFYWAWISVGVVVITITKGSCIVKDGWCVQGLSNVRIILMIVVVSSLVAKLDAISPTRQIRKPIIIEIWLKLSWGANLILVCTSADHADTVITTYHHSTCHMCVTSCQPINSLLLLVDDLWVLKYNGTEWLDTVMLRFKTHSNLAITSGTSHWHVWAILFQMVSKFFSSGEHPDLVSPEKVWMADKRTWHFDIWAFSPQMRCILLVGKRLLFVALNTLEPERV